MKITWEVEDGYYGKGRPQHCEIDDEELDLCETEEEKEKLIEEAVKEDFNSKISWVILDKS